MNLLIFPLQFIFSFQYFNIFVLKQFFFSSFENSKILSTFDLRCLFSTDFSFFGFGCQFSSNRNQINFYCSLTSAFDAKLFSDELDRSADNVACDELNELRLILTINGLGDGALLLLALLQLPLLFVPIESAPVTWIGEMADSVPTVPIEATLTAVVVAVDIGGFGEFIVTIVDGDDVGVCVVAVVSFVTDGEVVVVASATVTESIAFVVVVSDGVVNSCWLFWHNSLKTAFIFCNIKSGILNPSNSHCLTVERNRNCSDWTILFTSSRTSNMTRKCLWTGDKILFWIIHSLSRISTM